MNRRRVVAIITYLLAGLVLVEARGDIANLLIGSPDWLGLVVRLFAAGFGVWAGRRLWNDRPRSRGVNLGYQLVIFASMIQVWESDLDSLIPLPSPPLIFGTEPASLFERIAAWVLIEPWGLILCLVCLAVIAFSGIALSEGEETYLASGRGRRRRFLETAVTMAGWGYLAYVVEDLVALSGTHRDPSWWLDGPGMGQFFFPALFLLTVYWQSLTLNDEGVGILMFGRKVLFAPWAQVRQVVVVHGSDKVRAVIHYRSRLRIPISLSIDGDHYDDGDKLLRSFVTEAGVRGIAVSHIQPRGKNLGWILIGVGIALTVAQGLLSHFLFQQYAAGLFSRERFDQVAGVIPLTALYLGAILLISVGFGIHAASYRGGSRAILLALWMFLVRTLPDPLIHWLVWIALYSIDSGTLIINQIVPPAPYPRGLEVAMGVVQYGFLLAPTGFWLGVFLGKRPWHGEMAIAREAVSSWTAPADATQTASG